MGRADGLVANGFVFYFLLEGYQMANSKNEATKLCGHDVVRGRIITKEFPETVYAIRNRRGQIVITHSVKTATSWSEQDDHEVHIYQSVGHIKQKSLVERFKNFLKHHGPF